MFDTVFQRSALASGLVTPAQFDYVHRLSRHRARAAAATSSAEAVADDSLTPEQRHDRLLAELLVEQSVLTDYQASQLMLGRTKLNLGPYLITDFIGQGGMGQVFKGTHRVMGRECAVKVLPLDRATDAARASFLREIKLQAQLDCPHLVRAYDAGQDGSVHYLVTEYVPGMDLRKLIRASGPLKMHHAASIIMQAALGLEHAHQVGLVHRDVKPGNIMVTPDGIAKVSDIGLAGFSSDLMDDPRAGKIVGTIDYLSPEQIRTPLEVGSASDIYSLGCTLYYAVCGKVPFPGGDTKSKIRRHLDETPWHPRKFTADLSEDFVDIIADMMAKRAEERIHSAAEVAGRLEPWSSDVESIAMQQLTKTVWLAPPPPNEDDVDEVKDPTKRDSAHDASATDISGDSMLASDGGLMSSENVELTNLPIGLARETVETIRANQSSSRFTIIALTIAIILPPILLIGAILGFVLRGWL